MTRRSFALKRRPLWQAGCGRVSPFSGSAVLGAPGYYLFTLCVPDLALPSRRSTRPLEL